MGGILRLSVRKSSGEVVNMLHHTNNLTAKIVEGDFLDEGSCLDNMINDFNYNLKKYSTEDSRLNLNWYEKTVYGNNNILSPFYYGIVFIDFKEKKILSMQGYTNIRKVSFSSCILNVFHSQEYQDNKDLLRSSLMSHVHSDESYLDMLLRSNKLKNINILSFYGRKPIKYYENPSFDLVDLVDDFGILSTEFKNNDFDFIDSDLTLNGFTVTDFQEDASGINEFLDELKSLNIPVSPEEKKEWLSFH